jgi:uncharacterized membrane protein HdeD (DUF308 family)
MRCSACLDALEYERLEVERHMDAEARETKLWLFTLGRAAVALLFAVLALGNPWMPLVRLARIYAVYVLVDSGLSLFGARRIRQTHVVERGGWLGVDGAVSLAAAIVAFFVPTLVVLRVAAGLRGLFVGASDTLWARHGNASDLLELGGIAAVAFGIVIIAWPGPAYIALPWLLGVAALVTGALFFAGSMSELRRVSLLVA